MHRSLTRPLATVAVVLCLQLMATVMTLRRDPLTRFEGSAIAALLWTAFGSGGRRAAGEHLVNERHARLPAP
ncbi:MAG: hypothetical protein ACXVY5_08170 [Gaiellales bacterium]